MLLTAIFVELRVVAGRSRTRAGSPQAVSRRPCCAVALRRTAWHGRGMGSVNQTRPHCVNQMGKTHSKPLAAWHGRGTTWAQHAMCESDFILPSVRTETSPKEPTINLSILYVLEAPLPRCLLGPYLCHGVEPYFHSPACLPEV